jgi:hypothetical protein
MILPGDTIDSTCCYLGIAHGTVPMCVKRLSTAILDLYDTYLKWPSAEERRQIAMDLPGCIGLLDGTHLELKSKPSWRHEILYLGGNNSQ